MAMAANNPNALNMSTVPMMELRNDTNVVD